MLKGNTYELVILAHNEWTRLCIERWLYVALRGNYAYFSFNSGSDIIPLRILFTNVADSSINFAAFTVHILNLNVISIAPQSGYFKRHYEINAYGNK